MAQPLCTEPDGTIAHGIVPSIIHAPAPGDTAYAITPGLDGASASTTAQAGSTQVSGSAVTAPGTTGPAAGGDHATTALLIATGPYIMEEPTATTTTAIMITGLT